MNTSCHVIAKSPIELKYMVARNICITVKN